MEQYCLTNSNIDLICEETGRFLAKYGVERREILRAKLTFEELLLEYQSRFGEDAVFRCRYVNRFSTARVEIIIDGEAFDPLCRESEEGELAQSLLAKIGLAPTWSYKNGKNYIVFIPKKKPLSGTVKMAAAALMSVVAGLLLNLLPDGIRTGVNAYVLTPVTDAFMGLISAVSGPLVFLSVLGSIVSMGNMETLGKIGRETIKIILLYSTVIGVLMTMLGVLFYPVEWGSGGASNFKQVFDLLYDIVPSNLFEPFVTGNALQLIFIAVMVGLAMLVLSSKVNGVFNLVEQLNAIIQTVMTGLSSLLPVLIFVLFTGMLSNGSFASILDSWKMIAVFTLLCIIYHAGCILWIAVRKKVSPILLLKKAWPTYIIALTTASSGAAFSTNIKDAVRKLGISEKLVGFGTPIGQVLFMPGYIAELFAIEATLAQNCGISITVPWIIIAFITNLLLSYAIPPVPGGGAVCFAIVFAQLGIPAEMMGIAIAVDIITDFLGTATNVSGWQLTMIDAADSLDMLDRDVLRSAV